jgi:hypothetical protein
MPNIIASTIAKTTCEIHQQAILLVTRTCTTDIIFLDKIGH